MRKALIETLDQTFWWFAGASVTLSLLYWFPESSADIDWLWWVTAGVCVLVWIAKHTLINQIRKHR
jgi:hypothetical protein